MRKTRVHASPIQRTKLTWGLKDKHGVLLYNLRREEAERLADESGGMFRAAPVATKILSPRNVFAHSITEESLYNETVQTEATHPTLFYPRRRAIRWVR